RDWEVTGGGKVYLFHLKKGVMFHNGREVTAKDFKYSWERAASPDTKSPTVETYLGDIVGVKDVLAGRSKEIQGVRVIDDYTLEVTIDAPKAYFLSKLTYPVAFVVEKSNVESGTQWWQQPVGTGPFVVLEWKKDELFILARNNFYHGEKPKVENILYRLWGGRPMIMYETGAIDIADIYSSDIDRVRDPANPLAGEMKIFDVASLDYIAFGTDRPPFDDVKVRQAFALAVDKDKIIRRVLKDMYKKADGIIPPGIPGHNPGLKGLTYDVARAKELITSSSYGSVSNFPPITITIPGLGGDIPSDLAAIIQEWKENLGVQVMVRALEPEAYSYIIKEERDEMISSGWVADYPDPENFLDVLFHTDSQANDSGYGNPEIDVLMEAARVEQDPAKRLKMYRDIEQKLVDDGALIPLWFGRRHQLIKPYVQGYQLSPLGYPLLNGVSLSPH
ncbi:MAG: peptide ABC transporter substrate-binding protein, partial [Dehalococcoidia bacterium]|nr:peptide ABC transporter substrate-binding protein [Dehalococcoidia bacterium]